MFSSQSLLLCGSEGLTQAARLENKGFTLQLIGLDLGVMLTAQDETHTDHPSSKVNSLTRSNTDTMETRHK